MRAQLGQIVSEAIPQTQGRCQMFLAPEEAPTGLLILPPPAKSSRPKRQRMMSNRRKRCQPSPHRVRWPGSPTGLFEVDIAIVVTAG